MRTSTSKDMTAGNPLTLILSFAFPVFLSNLFQQVYTVADTAIVSKTLGDGALAAVGSIDSVNFLILGFCFGIGMGFSIPIAQCYGAKDMKELRKYAGNAIWVFLVVSLVMTVGSVLFCRTILTVTKTPAEIMEMAYQYLLVIFLGIPVQFAYNALASVIRSLGDSRSPLYILIVASLINIGLDLLFIQTFGLGTAGAALATVLSQLLSVIGCLLLIQLRIPELHLKRKDLLPDCIYMKELIRNGLPMGLQMSVTGIGSILLQTSVNMLGTVAVAAVTAAERICNTASIAITSLGNAMSVYCGQNLGAEKYQRIRKGVRAGICIGLLFSLLSFVLIKLFGRNLTLLFLNADSTELIEMTYRYLIIVAAFFWAQSLILTVRFSVQGLGRPNIALAACLLEMVARSVFGLLFVPKYGFTAAAFSSPAAWMMADALLFPSLLWILAKWAKEDA